MISCCSSRSPVDIYAHVPMCHRKYICLDFTNHVLITGRPLLASGVMGRVRVGCVENILAVNENRCLDFLDGFSIF